MAGSAAGELVPAVQTLDLVQGHGALASHRQRQVPPSQLPAGKPPEASLASRPEGTPVLVQCNIPAWWNATLSEFLKTSLAPIPGIVGGVTDSRSWADEWLDWSSAVGTCALRKGACESRNMGGALGSRLGEIIVCCGCKGNAKMISCEIKMEKLRCGQTLPFLCTATFEN